MRESENSNELINLKQTIVIMTLNLYYIKKEKKNIEHELLNQ